MVLEALEVNYGEYAQTTFVFLLSKDHDLFEILFRSIYS